MIGVQKILFGMILLIGAPQVIQAQEAVIPRLIWKVNKIDLGTVLEEEGPKIAEFEFTHTQDSLFFIELVVTDCGCTTVSYNQDTLAVGESGRVAISFDPSSGAGYFSRMIIVKGNLMNSQDTLYIEGTAVPFPEKLESAYQRIEGNLGFRLNKVNMGEVLTNEPKLKQVEIFNFGAAPINAQSLTVKGPSFIQVTQRDQLIFPNQRGLLDVYFDGNEKGDLGFSEDQVVLSWGEDYLVRLAVLANVFEYFPPIPKDELNDVAQLAIDPKEIDLRTISTNNIQKKLVTLTNKGREELVIRKIQGNCECLTLEIPKTTLRPGESIELQITFNPKGRKG
ncbi:MAG: hypothetical protein ACJAWX_002848, partial [Algoriphagus sp.]